MNLNEALKRAEELGCKVSKLFRTGEVRVELPGRSRRLRLNGRRKDCPAVLETVIRQIENGSLREDVLVDRTELPEQEEQPAKERKRFRPPPAIRDPQPSGTIFIPEPAEALWQPSQQIPVEPPIQPPAERVEQAELDEPEELEEIEPEPTEEELTEIRQRLKTMEDLEDTLYGKAFRIFMIMHAPRKPGPPMKVGLTTEEMEANQARKRAERAEREQEKIRKAAEKRKRREEKHAQAADLPDQGT